MSTMQTGSGNTTAAYPSETSGTTGTTGAARQRSRRVSTETKAAFKTTEFFVYIACVAGVLIASLLVGSDSATGKGGAATGDYFRADRAWVLVTVLTVGYMLARGIAKSGSRDFYDDVDERR